MFTHYMLAFRFHIHAGQGIFLMVCPHLFVPHVNKNTPCPPQMGTGGVHGLCKEHKGENVGECVLTINDSNNTKYCPDKNGNVEDDGQYCCNDGNYFVAHFSFSLGLNTI